MQKSLIDNDASRNNIVGMWFYGDFRSYGLNNDNSSISTQSNTDNNHIFISD